MPELYGFLIHFLHFKPDEIIEMSDDQLNFYCQCLSKVLKAKYGSSDKNESNSNNSVGVDNVNITPKNNNRKMTDDGRNKGKEKIIYLDDNGQRLLSDLEQMQKEGKKLPVQMLGGFLNAYF